MAEVLALLAEDPRTVGPYRLEGRLGVGGQGTVYVGRGDDGVPVAVKLLHPHLMADQREQKRFLLEVETARRVALFCTAQMLDCGFLGSRPYIVSEFVDGPSLHAAVRDNGPRGAAALQRLAINTATALMAIHEAGVVHRDFKPGNVLLGPEGPVVIDFGIARALDLSQSVVSSQAIGSPAYMAPEQISGGGVGPAGDLFAWAATMVYAATGEHAFTGDSIPGVLHAILHGEPDLGGLQGPLRGLLEECLSKAPDRRPTAAQVIERLRALPSPVWNTVPITRPGRPAAAQNASKQNASKQAASNRRRGLIMGTAGATLLVAAVAGYFALAPVASGDRAPGTTSAASVPVSVPSVSSVPSPSTNTPETPLAQDTPVPAATERKLSAEAVPSPSTVSRGTPTQTHTPRRTKASVVEPTRKPTKKPTRRPTTKPTKTTPPPSSGPPQPAQGSITFNDAHEYCKAEGYSMAAGNWDNLSCFGMTSKNITATSVCQFKYQGRNAVAEQPQYAYSQETTCRLS
ncbi:serine/threonine-protein kinase [Nonomuraea sp. NPDC050153]|uniref:serine/threonine-protein kinase n=1 Tax=Nonomuraea sp. NPDC050153 TaxID=3364359 RepID=UPI0037959B72